MSKTTVLAYTFVTSNKADDMAHKAIERLAHTCNVWAADSFLVAKNFVAGNNKHSITVSGTEEDVEKFHKQAKNIAREW